MVAVDPSTVCHVVVSAEEVSQESKPSSTISRSPVPESRDAARRRPTRRDFEVIGFTALVKELRIELMVSEPERLRLELLGCGESRSMGGFSHSCEGTLGRRVGSPISNGVCLSSSTVVG